MNNLFHFEISWWVKTIFLSSWLFLVLNLGMMANIAILVYTAYDPSYTTTPQKCYLLSSFINLTVHFTVIKTNSYFWPSVMIKGYVWKIITIKTNCCAIDKILLNAKYFCIRHCINIRTEVQKYFVKFKLFFIIFKRLELFPWKIDENQKMSSWKYFTKRVIAQLVVPNVCI